MGRYYFVFVLNLYLYNYFTFIDNLYLNKLYGENISGTLFVDSDSRFQIKNGNC